MPHTGFDSFTANHEKLDYFYWIGRFVYSSVCLAGSRFLMSSKSTCLAVLFSSYCLFMQPKYSVCWQAPNYGQDLKGPGWTVKIYTGTPLIWDLASVFPVEKWDVSIKDLVQGYIAWIGTHVFTAAQGECQSISPTRSSLLLLHFVKFFFSNCILSLLINVYVNVAN